MQPEDGGGARISRRLLGGGNRRKQEVVEGEPQEEAEGELQGAGGCWVGELEDAVWRSWRMLGGGAEDAGCTFSLAKPPINPLFLAVFWYFQDKEILRYDNKGLSLGPRVLFSKEAANNGDVSVSLANVSISDGGIYRCLVIYSPEKKEKEVLLEIFAPPVIRIPNKVIQKNKENTLTCTASGFYPVDIDVSWYKDNKHLTDSQLDKPERNPDGTYRVRGTVTLPPMDGQMDHYVSCRVQHRSLQQPLQEDAQLEYEAKPVPVSVVPTLCDSGEILYSLTLRGFYPRNISITWTCGAGDSQGRILSTELYEENPDLTFSVCSEARISGDQYKDPAFRVGVAWEHGSLDAPGYREISAQDPEFPWKPAVEPIQEAQFLHNSPTTLRCNISGYFPDALTVTWLRKGAQSEELTEVPNTHPYIWPHKQPDSTYSCTASLIIYPSLRDQGAEYTCRVAHPSLGEPIDTSTGRINVMAKPVCQDPVQMDLLTNGRVQFSLTLRSFYPQDIEINWILGETQYTQPPTDTVTQSDPLTYDITSVCSFPGNLFCNPEYKHHVTWSHVTMEAPESRELWVTDPQYKAHVTWSHVTMEPRELWVTDTSKKEKKGDQSEASLSTKRYKVPEPKSQRQENQTFTCETELSFSPEQKTDQGAEFIYRVGHPSLGQLVERRAGPLVIPE
uniref:Ig-like domain-containing protein n=1 Tax=Xenopus tropicalis TaxID=8364 RepID=A0A1B8Y3X1_XENTR